MGGGQGEGRRATQGFRARGGVGGGVGAIIRISDTLYHPYTRCYICFQIFHHTVT